MAEPVTEAEGCRGHPDRPLAADDRHGEGQRDCPKPQLFLRGIHRGEADPKWNELADTGEQVQMRIRLQRQLHAERNGEEEHREWTQPAPIEPAARARDAARRVQVPSREKELPPPEPE